MPQSSAADMLQHAQNLLNLHLQGRTLYVKLGDKEVEFNKSFRLFLHTKLSKPHFPPETQAETTIINFTVTEDGLEDQLLALVVNKERPDLEETKSQLIIQVINGSACLQLYPQFMPEWSAFPHPWSNRVVALAHFLTHERTACSSNVLQNTEFTIKLKQLMDGLLSTLSNAEGDLTENVPLIESLEQSKALADEVSEKVLISALLS